MLDLVIRNARTLEDECFELGIKAGQIVKIAPIISEPTLKELTLQAEERISAGWIDDHVHCFEEMSLYYDYPDAIGVTKGVTTVIDAGSTGAENIGRFQHLAVSAQTNVFALVNISEFGIVEQDELADLTKIRFESINRVLQEYPNFICGIKARISKSVIGDNGLIPLSMAKAIQQENDSLPLMVHIGSNPPELTDILALMEKGDILTHCFNGKENGILDQKTGQIRACVWQAKQQGIIFDLGHGTDSFNFKTAEFAHQTGLKADSISTDIYVRNRKNGPVYDLATTMEKMRLIGYSWPEIIKKVTVIPATSFHLTSKGMIAEGFDADLTIFEVSKGEKKLTDSNSNQRTIHEVIRPCKTIIGGIIYDNLS